MKKVLKFSVIAAFAVLSAACSSDIDGLRKDVDELKGRVEAVEKQIDVLNGNVEALKVLMNGATVNSVAEKDGIYTVTLSNGEVLTLSQGSEGGYLTPLISVDDEDYWTVSTDGETFTRILDKSGQPVKAVAKDGDAGTPGVDGITPKFKVEGGFWVVSYDEGVSYVQVLDEEGQSVSATSGALQDKFFADIKVSGNVLEISLLTGAKISVPIVSGFKCIIDGAADIVMFARNQTLEFDVDMAGVASTIVLAPEGWSAALSEKASPAAGAPAWTLAVSAPLAQTRAAADSRTDVSIIAVASNGLSTIAKMKVALSGEVLYTPVVTDITVDNDLTTETSLGFTAALSDATGFKYLCLPADDAAPDAAAVLTTGTEGVVGGTTAISGLTGGTDYVIYAAAYHGSTLGTAVETAAARTRRGLADYWEDGVTIAGATYSKNTEGAQLITSSATPITSNGVYFLDLQEGEQVTLNKLTVTNLVIIGRHSDVRGKVVLASGAFCSLAEGNGLIFKNIELDVTAGNTGYKFNFADGTFTAQNFIIEDSKVITPVQNFSYFNIPTATIGKVVINNSIIKIEATADFGAMRLMNFNQGCGIAPSGSVSITNNALYSDGFVTQIALLHINQAAGVMDDVSINVTNNSLINVIGSPNAYLNLSTGCDVNFTKNILWCKSYPKPSYTLRFLAQPTGTLDYKDNKVYGLIDDNDGCWTYFSGTVVPEAGSYTKESSDPFAEMDLATDTFVSRDPAYGCTIE